MKHIEIDCLKVAGKPGSTIGDCFQEAIVLAATEWRNVRLSHQGNYYVIQPNDLIAGINKCQEDRKLEPMG